MGSKTHCDKQGGARAVRERSEAGGMIAEERHLRTAPVSYLSWRSSRSITAGPTTVKNERGPGLDYFTLCFVYVCAAVDREALLLLLSFCCLFILWLLKLRWTFTGSRLLLPWTKNFATLVPKLGGRRDILSESPRSEGDRSAEEVMQRRRVETASGCPRRWCWSDKRTGGMESSLPCSWVEVGGGVAAVQGACCRPPWWGGAGNGGAIAGHQGAEKDWAVHRTSSTIAWHCEEEPLGWLRTEQQRVWEPDQKWQWHTIYYGQIPNGSEHPYALLPSKGRAELWSDCGDQTLRHRCVQVFSNVGCLKICQWELRTESERNPVRGGKECSACLWRRAGWAWMTVHNRD